MVETSDVQSLTRMESGVWGPQYTKGVSKLGRVQCRSTEVIRDWNKKKPGELGLFSLMRRMGPTQSLQSHQEPSVSGEDKDSESPVLELFLVVSLVIKEPTKTGDLLDLILKKEELVGSVKISSILDCRNHEMVEFRICITGVDSEVSAV
ncbi:hypothetical protein QYF61_018291 [Mycteria americana]|uniref:Uncharacterized protein n=1 Tax=Mycteria americana TaxID=33587 RepID=A0AAN7MT45_MYCAM|nr:hypothetical protein QYF61_018291 [Mycteria americana]